MEKLSGPAKPKAEQSGDGNISEPSAAIPKPVTPENVEPAKPKINILPAAAPTAGSENPFTKLTSRPTSSTPSVRKTSETSLKRPRAESVEQSTTNAPPRKT